MVLPTFTIRVETSVGIDSPSIYNFLKSFFLYTKRGTFSQLAPQGKTQPSTISFQRYPVPLGLATNHSSIAGLDQGTSR